MAKKACLILGLTPVCARRVAAMELHLTAGRAQCTPTPTALAIALCYSGEYRTLDVMHDSTKAAMANFAGDHLVSFFFITAGPLEHQCAYHDGCARKRSISMREGAGAWTYIEDRDVKASILQYAAWNCQVHAWYAPAVAQNDTSQIDASQFNTSQFCRGDAEQYWKLQQVFRKVLQHEAGARQGRLFDWVLRLRTDVWFLSKLPTLSSLVVRRVYVPHGIVNPTVPVNDQMAIVPRSLASAYFDAAEDLECNTSTSIGKYNGKTFLRDRLRRARAPIYQLNIGLVLLRSGLGAACWRLKSHPQTLQWWSACLNLSVTLPVYCAQPNGTVLPNTPSYWKSFNASLSVLNTPRCSELPEEGLRVQSTVFVERPWPTGSNIYRGLQGVATVDVSRPLDSATRMPRASPEVQWPARAWKGRGAGEARAMW